MTDQERQPLIVLSQLDAHADIRQSSCFTRFFSRVPARYGLVFASALGFFSIYSLRLDLSLAILAIVDSETSLQNATTHHHVCFKYLLSYHPAVFNHLMFRLNTTGHQNSKVSITMLL